MAPAWRTGRVRFCIIQRPAMEIGRILHYGLSWILGELAHVWGQGVGSSQAQGPRFVLDCPETCSGAVELHLRVGIRVAEAHVWCAR